MPQYNSYRKGGHNFENNISNKKDDGDGDKLLSHVAEKCRWSIVAESPSDASFGKLWAFVSPTIRKKSQSSLYPEATVSKKPS